MNRREAFKAIGKTAGGLFIAQFTNCKLFETPNEFHKVSDIVEFMYQRTLPIVDDSSSDPKGMTVYSKGGCSAGNPSNWTFLGNNQWTAKMSLIYCASPYWVYMIDGKVTGKYETIAETIFARIKGNSKWINLIF